MTGAYLVDLDGVLVDSLGAAIRSWTWWASLHGLDPGPFIRAHGRPSREAIAELAPQLDADAEAALVEKREVGDTDVVALPGATAMLAAARPVAIVTSGGRRLAEARLRAAGLQRPEVLVSVDSISRGKPDPEPYLYAAQRLQISPSRCHSVRRRPRRGRCRQGGRYARRRAHHYRRRRELAGADCIVRDLAEYLDGGVS